jgi:hypothetical protein
MIERLGQVIYWALSGLGVLIVLGSWVLLYNHADGITDPGLGIVMSLIAGGICWLIGRACLYVLAGR